MNDHLYFIFDPQFDVSDLQLNSSLYIKEWSVPSSAHNDSTIMALSLWATHNFIDEPDEDDCDYEDDESDDRDIGEFNEPTYEDDEEDDEEGDEFDQLYEEEHQEGMAEPTFFDYDDDDDTVGAYTKAHNSTMALRAANQVLYSIAPPTDASVEVEPQTIGYHVNLPEHLSQRQLQWFDLIDAPTRQDVVTVTLDEYLLLKNLKVLSAAHSITPIKLYPLPYNPLNEQMEGILDGIPPSIAALSPDTTGEIVIARTQFLHKLSVPGSPDSQYYDLQALANRQLIIRSERLHQIKALIYADYYVAPSRYLSDTHKLMPTWIQKRPIVDTHNLLYKEYGVDGWFRSEYAPNTLLTALTVLACVGYWSIECDAENTTELLTTAAEGFVYAHRSDGDSNRRLYQMIYHPQNPFDLRKSLVQFNSLMPLLAAICNKPKKKGLSMALFFDNKENRNALTEALISADGNKAIIQNFIEAMGAKEEFRLFYTE